MVDEPRLTHLDAHGHAQMVDVTNKPWTRRVAVACSQVRWSRPHEELTVPAELVTQAQVAGMQAAKLAWDLIPLCHPIRLIDVSIGIVPNGSVIDIEAVTEVQAPTGVEMEALTACSVAGLVLVDGLRRHDPRIALTGVTLLRKEGGRSGVWVRPGGVAAGH